MAGIEQRKEPRIPASQLPETYREFSVFLGHGVEAPVTTIDASLSGFGFVSPLSADNFLVGSRIVLFPLGDSHPVYGVVRFSAPTDHGCRVGVALEDLGGYTKYRAGIETHAAQMAIPG